MKRRLIFRWTAAAVLWLLLAVAVFASVKSAVTVAEIRGTIPEIVTPQQEEKIAKIRELAKAFAVEWATWGEDYTKRLNTFVKTNLEPPEGKQTATFAVVISTEEVEDNTYKVKVHLNTKRLIIDEEKEKQEWINKPLIVEILVDAEKEPKIASLPLIVSANYDQGRLTERYVDPASEELQAFIKQFLTAYYEGEPLTNFTTSDAKIQTLGGYELKKLIKAYTNGDQVRAEVEVSTEGIENLRQIVHLTIQKHDNSYLVKEVKPSL